MGNLPKPIVDLANKALGVNSNFTIDTWDLDRIYITKDNDDYTIRMWNITEDEIRWTLFKTVWESDGSGHGEEVDSGIFEYEVEQVSVSTFSIEDMEHEMNESKFVTLVMEFLKDEIVDCDSCSEEYGITLNLKDINFTKSGKQWEDAIDEFLSEQGYGVRITFGNGNWTTIYKIEKTPTF